MNSTPISPVGNGGFRIPYEKLSEPKDGQEILYQTSFGAHVILLIRENSNTLAYYHWSPGTGGRVAKADLSKIPKTPTVQIAFNWHPRKTQLLVASVEATRSTDLIAEGKSTNKKFRKNRIGQITQVGDEGIDILDMRIELDGAPLLLPTAHENWRSTKQACETLQRGKSEDGYIFEVVKNNSILTKLVTGFETYCKTRIIEMETEGIQPNIKALSKLLVLKSENENSLCEDTAKEANELGISVLELWLANQRRINFQEFDKAKDVFNKTYQLKFGEIGISSNDIAELKILFRHRHRVIHVSPIATLTPNNDPSLGNRLLVEAPDRFEKFIETLHIATLSIGIPDSP